MVVIIYLEIVNGGVVQIQTAWEESRHIDGNGSLWVPAITAMVNLDSVTPRKCIVLPRYEMGCCVIG